MNLQILHVIPSIAPRYGGPSTAILPMVEALNRLPNIRAEIATTDADGSQGRLDASVFADSPFPIHVFTRDWSEQWKYSASMWRWLRDNARRYDIIHVHSLWNFATLAACRAARRAGVPIVVRPCGMLSPYTWSRTPWRKRLYWALVERFNVRHACRFHATSQAEADEIRAVVNAPVVVIPQGIDPAAWTAVRRPEFLRERCGPAAGDRPIILFLSRLHPKKGILDLLLPAFAKLAADAYLAIVGGEDEHEPGFGSRVRHEIDRLRLTDRVGLLGRIVPAERWWLLDGAAVFVLPSHSENFGIVVTEAMARGVPVVVTDTVQACEHVLAAQAGYVTPRDVNALSTALTRVLADDAAARLLGQHGKEYAAREFQWDRIAELIGQMYRECFNTDRRRASPGSHVSPEDERASHGP